MSYSIALCTYNGEQFIEEQIRSIESQIIIPDEIIVCDDGSTDETIRLIELLSEESQITYKIYVNESNIGVVKNFEKAISLCSSEFIFLCDQDDIWYENKSLQVLKYFEENPSINVVFTNGNVYAPENKQLSSSLFDIVGFNLAVRERFSNGYAMEVLNIENRITGATMALRSEYMNCIIPFNSKLILHDEIIGINAVTDKCIGYIDECLIKYRIHSNQQVGLGNWFEIPPSTNVYVCNLVKEDYTDIISRSESLKRRSLFLKKRKSFIRSYLGLALIVLNKAKYKHEYGKDSNAIISADLKEYVTLNKARISKFIL